MFFKACKRLKKFIIYYFKKIEHVFRISLSLEILVNTMLNEGKGSLHMFQELMP